MQLYSQPLELRILRTLTSSKGNSSAKLAGLLNQECFHTSTAKQVYSRVMAIAQSRSIILSWDELLHDTVLKQSVRKVLTSFKKKPYADKEQVLRKVKQLHNYRQLRAIYFAADYAREALQAESADPNTILTGMMDKLNKAKPSSDQSSNMVHIGGKDKSSSYLLKSILNPPKNKYIPTGIKAFQKHNPGLPRGAYVNIASTTGSGKSVLSNQLASNMALNGAKVAIVQLEMDQLETGQRQAARFSRINMGKIVDPKKLQQADIEKIEKSWKKLNKRIKERGGLLTIYTPDEDFTIQEIFAILEPFGYDVIIIDYIGLLKGTDGDDQVRALSRVGRFLKVYAKNNNMITITCAQLNEEGKVKYARAITEHAQVAFYWTVDAKSKENRIYRIDMPKSRNLKSISFYLKERFDIMKFEDMDENEVRSYKNKQNSNGKNGNKGSSKGATRRQNSFKPGEGKKEFDAKDYYLED